MQSSKNPFQSRSLLKTTYSKFDHVSSTQEAYNRYNSLDDRRRNSLDDKPYQSLDDRLFRRTLQDAKEIESKRLESPLAYTDGLNIEINTSRPNSRAESRSRACSSVEGYNLYSAENSPIHSNVYSHSNLLPENEEIVYNDPVISYDQEIKPVTKDVGNGSLSFVLQYHSAAPMLLITVKSALDLPCMTGNTDGSVNSSVNLCLVPEDFLWKRTRVIKNDRDPVFNETFEIRDVLYHKLREYILCFYVMDKHDVLGERVIGKILYPLSDLRAEQTVEVCKELSLP